MPVAVVTGAGRGIGRAIAAAYAQAGYAVVGTARDPATVDPEVALALPCDVTDEASVAALAAAVLDRFGAVHTVVANAGVTGPIAPLHEIDLADWRACLAADLDGVFLTFRAFVPALVAAGTGSLVAISSMTGKRPMVGRSPYAAAKMGVIGLVRTLAVELGPHGVRVNAVCPGAVGGPRLDAVVRTMGQDAARAAFTGPLGRVVEADEVAAACVYLSSPAAASITGEDLNVNGGVVMY